MHSGCSIFIGFGGFDRNVKLPQMFEDIFGDPEDGEGQVMDKNGNIVEEDYADDGNNHATTKKFRRIGDEAGWRCYGFEIARFDSIAEIDLVTLAKEAEYWLLFAQRIKEKYKIKMTPKVHILSFAR